MNDLYKSDLESACRKFLSTSQEILSWIWDDRFEAVLAQFATDKKDKVRTILERYLSIAWNISNINKAPDTVQTINNRLGGLRSGQMLFTSDPNLDVFVFCSWWPWDDGKTISIRVAPFYKTLSDSGKAELIIQFRGWFGI